MLCAQNRVFFRRKRVLGETNKNPLRFAQVVRLVSLRRLSNLFDSRNRPPVFPIYGNRRAAFFCFVQRSRALLEAIQSLYKNSTSWSENSI